MTESASEKAAAFLMGDTTNARVGTLRGATGDHARLRELVLDKGDLTEDEQAEFEELVAKRRAGTLSGSPARVTHKRESVGGEREGDNMGGGRQPRTASEAAGDHLLGRS